MKKVVSFLLCMALGIFTLLGQARVITGTVVSADDGGTLPGVSVAVKGISIGTITDVNGNYQLNVPDNTEIIVFSFVGLLNRRSPYPGRIRSM